MKLKTRSFPHPVLGNGDDVPGAAMQTVFEPACDKSNYYLKTRFDCSSETLLALIGQGGACYLTHIECTNTVFRARQMSADAEQTNIIPADKLNGHVEVNFFICATKPIPTYRINGAHPDYGDTAFSIRKGDILAVADGRTFEAEKDPNALRRVSSIMQIQESADDGDGPMQLSFGAHKIRVLLSKPDFADYKLLKGQEQLQPALSAAIVLPALIEILRIMQAEGDDYAEYRWYQNLKHRLDEIDEGHQLEPFVAAQKLLELPLRRALQQAKTFAFNS